LVVIVTQKPSKRKRERVEALKSKDKVQKKKGGERVILSSDEEKMREKIMELLVLLKSVVSSRTGHVPVLSPPWWACLADLTEADYHAH